MSMNPFDRQAPIPGIKKIIVVGSGKGGVGKSTVTANLALALKERSAKVGVLDSDIYGPSIPRLCGAINQPLYTSPEGRIEPILRHGLKLMSMGFLVNENQAVVWRGPMLFKAFEQFFRDVNWGELDYLLIDLPPGTGDVALTIAQKVPVNGAIVVCTPQNLALVDAKKAVDMFYQIRIPMLGLVENMSYLAMPAGPAAGDDGASASHRDTHTKDFDSGEATGANRSATTRMQLFPKGELDQYLDAKGILKLAELPFDPTIGLSSEAGMPQVISSPESEASQQFFKLADKILALS